MSRIVVVDHHYDANANVYRLTFASEDGFGPSEEIVWDADDERWQDKDEDEIASEQRRTVSDMLTARAAYLEAEEARAAESRRTLGEVGVEL